MHQKNGRVGIFKDNQPCLRLTSSPVVDIRHGVEELTSSEIVTIGPERSWVLDFHLNFCSLLLALCTCNKHDRFYKAHGMPY